jgi:hypothetical protein
MAHKEMFIMEIIGLGLNVLHILCHIQNVCTVGPQKLGVRWTQSSILGTQ